MEDRELLEMAAKAIGKKLGHSVGGGMWINDEEGRSRSWNPLTDDGDALRLAVKLGIRIDPKFSYPADDEEQSPAVHAVWVSGDIGDPTYYGYGGEGLDTFRRLIVLAAAHIARYHK